MNFLFKVIHNVISRPTIEIGSRWVLDDDTREEDGNPFAKKEDRVIIQISNIQNGWVLYRTVFNGTPFGRGISCKKGTFLTIYTKEKP